MAVATDTLERIVLAALAEDVGQGDVTTDGTVPADSIGTAELLDRCHTSPHPVPAGQAGWVFVHFVDARTPIRTSYTVAP